MGKWTGSWMLLLGLLVMAEIKGAGQTAPPPRTNSPNHNHSVIENNPACQRILSECKNLGFIQGQWKKDNGLWRDCFDPVVKGRTPTRDGKAINVPVSGSDVQSCRAAVGRHR